MKKILIIPIISLLLLSNIAFAQEEQIIVSESDAGTLPSSRVLWAFDRFFDRFQDDETTAKERLAELKAELTRNNPEAADRARTEFEVRRNSLSQVNRDRFKTEVEKAEKEYNEKFDFDLGQIKEKVNTYLATNDRVLEQNVKVNLIGNKKSSFEIIVGNNGFISEIKKLDVESSPDASITLSHGNIYAALKSDQVFNSMIRNVIAQVGKEKGLQMIRPAANRR